MVLVALVTVVLEEEFGQADAIAPASWHEMIAGQMFSWMIPRNRIRGSLRHSRSSQ